MSAPPPTPAAPAAAVCILERVGVIFPARDVGDIAAVHDVSLAVASGETVGIVGESGSGKSTLALAILRLVPEPGRVSGTIRVEGSDVMALAPRALAQIRGRRVGLILQDPTPSLNPVRTIASQLGESARLAGLVRAARAAAIAAALREVELEPAAVLKRYPNELSGGMNQRVAIAMALLQRPALLIADEPTTALDVTTQGTILALLDRCRRNHTMALILISHDLGAVYQLADRLAVMYAGHLVELGQTETVVHRPAHPYTQALVACVPSFTAPAPPAGGIPGQLEDSRVGEERCPFSRRCTAARDICHERYPPEVKLEDGHRVRCWAVASP